MTTLDDIARDEGFTPLRRRIDATTWIHDANGAKVTIPNKPTLDDYVTVLRELWRAGTPDCPRCRKVNQRMLTHAS